MTLSERFWALRNLAVRNIFQKTTLALSFLLLLTGLLLRILQKPAPFDWQPPEESWLRPTITNGFLTLRTRKNTLRAIAIDEKNNRIWIAGDSGILLKSLDDGKTWTPKKHDAVTHATDIYYDSNENTLYVAGHDGRIAVSNDGGDSWQSFIRWREKPERVYQIVKHEQTLFAVGERPSVITRKTSMKDSKWDSGKTPPTNRLYSIAVSPSGETVAVGQKGTILHYDRTKNSWSKSDLPGTSDDLYRVTFAAREPGDGPYRPWAVGANGTLLSRDNTKKWVKNTLTEMANLYDVHFIDPKHGWAVGAEGTILYTEDSGNTWNNYGDKVTNKTLLAVRFKDGLRGWVAGENGELLTTQDGGQSWTRNVDDLLPAFRDVHFIDENTGWAVGDHGRIVTTLDGGDTWIPQNSGTSRDLYFVTFINEAIGIAGGEGGTLLRTSNGGKSWAILSVGEDMKTSTIRDACLLDDTTIIAVGDNYRITKIDLKKYLTAEPLTEELPEKKGNLLAIDCRDNKAVAVGENGVILIRKTSFMPDDASWERRRTETTATLSMVRIFDEGKKIVAASNQGFFLYSEDEGNTWTEPELMAVRGLRNLFYDAYTQIVYATGYSNERATDATDYSMILLFSKDQGKAWQIVENKDKTFAKAKDLACDAHKGTIWCVGESGLFLKSADGGQKWIQLTSKIRPPFLSLVLCSLATGLAALGFPWLWLWQQLKNHRTKKTRARTREGIRPDIVNDMPRQAGGEDALGFIPVANAIVSVITAQNTEARIAIAIAGPWGSGKSSLLQMIAEKLRRMKYRVVWYNAWHHEKERRQMVSLLETIRRDSQRGSLLDWARIKYSRLMNWRYSVPVSCAVLIGVMLLVPWIDDGVRSWGWKTFAKYVLLGRQPVILEPEKLSAERERFRTISGTGEGLAAASERRRKILDVLAGFDKEGRRVFSGWAELYDAITEAEPSLKEKRGNNAEPGLAPDETVYVRQYFQKVAALDHFQIASLVALIAGYLSLVGFRKNPALRLALQRTLEYLGMRRFEAEPVGTVNDYEREFSLLAEDFQATNRPVAILIDDLDRCEHRTIQEMLEIISYLTHAGPCYIVAAFDPYEVLACLPGGSEGRKREYLEKIFNITVRMPRMTPKEIEELIEGLCVTG